MGAGYAARSWEDCTAAWILHCNEGAYDDSASTMTCCMNVCEGFSDSLVPYEVKLIVSGTGQLLAFA